MVIHVIVRPYCHIVLKASILICREIGVRNENLIHPLIANILSNELFSPREMRNQFNMQNLAALFQVSNPLGSPVSSREEHSARVSATLAHVFADFLLVGADSSGAPTPAEQVSADGEQHQQQQQQMSESHAPALRERLRELHRMLRGEHGSGSSRGATSASASGSSPSPVPALDLVSFALSLMHPRLEERDALPRPLCARLNSLDELVDSTQSSALEHKFSQASPAYKRRFVEAVVELVTLSQLYSVTPQVNEILFSNGEFNRTSLLLLTSCVVVYYHEYYCMLLRVVQYPLSAVHSIASADRAALQSFLTGISVIQDAAICWLCDCVFAHWMEAALSLNDFVHLYDVIYFVQLRFESRTKAICTHSITLILYTRAYRAH